MLLAGTVPQQAGIAEHYVTLHGNQPSEFGVDGQQICPNSAAARRPIEETTPTDNLASGIVSDSFNGEPTGAHLPQPAARLRLSPALQDLGPPISPRRLSIYWRGLITVPAHITHRPARHRTHPGARDPADRAHRPDHARHRQCPTPRAKSAAVSGGHRNASASFCDGVIQPRVCRGLELSE